MSLPLTPVYPSSPLLTSEDPIFLKLIPGSDLCLSKFDDVITMDQGRILFRGSSKKKTSNIEEMIGNRNLGGNDNVENLKTASTPTERTTVASVDSVARSLPDEDESAATAPSDWSIYLFFARSMSVPGFLVFVALAMAMGAERSFESKTYTSFRESFMGITDRALTFLEVSGCRIGQSQKIQTTWLIMLVSSQA